MADGDLENISNLENLVSSVKNTVKELNDLTKNITEGTDITSVESYKKSLDSYREKLIDFKNDLENLSGAERIEKEATIKEIEEDLKTLEESINNLETTPSVTVSPESKEENEPTTPKKNRTLSEWFEDQRTSLTSKEERKKNKGENILRAMGGVGLAGGIVALCKRIFGGSDDKEGFRDRPVGQVLKWAGLGVGTIFGIKLLSSKEDSDIKARDSKKYESYNEFAENTDNKETFDNYENLGEYIDVVYNDLYDRELKAGYQDELKMNRISVKQSDGEKEYKGIVPYCIDSHFRTVEDFLGQNSSMKEALSKNFDGMLNYLISRGNDFLELFANIYLNNLPSRMPFKTAAGSLKDRINQWRLEDAEAEEEMAYFFRQSIRVQTYFFEKRDQLEDKLLDEAVVKYGIDKETIEGDKNQLAEYVYKNKDYQLFISGKIADANLVLKKYGIFDCQINDDVKETTKELDKQRDNIVPKVDSKDLLEIIANKKDKGEKLTDEEIRQLVLACDNICADIDDSILEIVEDSARNIRGDFLRPFRSTNPELREYVDTAGIKMFFEEYKELIKKYKEDLQNGTLEDDDKYTLAECINNMLALKKEAILGAHTIDIDEDENGNIIYRVPGFLTGSFENVVKGCNKICHGKVREGSKYIYSGCFGFGVTITIVGGIVTFFDAKTGVKIMEIGAKTAVAPVVLPYKGVKFIINSNKNATRFVKQYGLIQYIGTHSGEHLYDNLKDGIISLQTAGDIIERKTAKNFRLKSTKSSIFNKLGFSDGTTSEVAQEGLLRKLIDDWRPDGKVFISEIEKQPGCLKMFAEWYDKSPAIKDFTRKGNAGDLYDTLRFLDYADKADVKIKNSSDFRKVIKEIITAEDQILSSKLLQTEITKSLQRITDFRQEMSQISSVPTLKRQWALFELLEKSIDDSRGICKFTLAIDDLKELEKILKKSGEIEIVVNGNKKKISFSKILEKGNIDDIDEVFQRIIDLKKTKQLSNFADISDDSLKSLLKVFKELKLGTVKRFANKLDDAGKAFKCFIKIVAKIS